MADGADQQPVEAALLDAIRRGDQRATEVMFERHVAYARAAAGRWVTDAAEREDLVSEAFARVLSALQRGNGPSENFRPYLLVTIRNLAHAWTARSRRVELHDEVPEQPDGPHGLDDIAVRRWESRTVWSAFWDLPERWRVVLWYTEIEGIPPVKVAPLMGITPRAVAALGLRAREGLRQAYLQKQVPSSAAPDCAAARQHLGAWMRGALPRRKAKFLELHLQDCPHCRELTTSLSGDNGRLRRVTALPAAAALGQGSQFAAMSTGASKVAAVAIATALSVSVPSPGAPFVAAASPPDAVTVGSPAPAAAPAPAVQAPATTPPSSPATSTQSASKNASSNGNAKGNGNGNSQHTNASSQHANANSQHSNANGQHAGGNGQHANGKGQNAGGNGKHLAKGQG